MSQTTVPTTATRDGEARGGTLRRRWPALAGLVSAALIALDLVDLDRVDGVGAAPVLAAAAAVYLGAAALRRQAAAWPLCAATAVVIMLAQLAGAYVLATSVLLAGGLGLAAYGLLRGALRPSHGVPLQTLALVLFGGAALAASTAAPDLGAYLVAGGLLCHGAWDVHHHRTGRVVARSLSEFCVWLDIPLALVLVLAAALT